MPLKLVAAPLKYQRVEAEIRQLCVALPIGARLPSERALADSFHCNFLTVRKALKQLVADGTVVRRVGSGTFILHHTLGDNTASPAKNRIGILVYQESDPYAYRIMQAIAHACMDRNVELQSAWVRDFRENGLAQARQLQQQGCVAIILPWLPFEKTEDIQAFVRNCPLPISLPMVIPGLEKYCFEEARIFGSHALFSTDVLCRYYRALGHQRIALIGPDSANDMILQKKLSAYTCYTSREALPSLCGLLAPGAAAMDQLAERWKAYRGDLAIIAYDDTHALRFLTAMHKIGLSAPKDFCIIGFNNTEASRYSDPPLSTIAQNFDYIGQWLLKNALALSQGKVSQSSKNARVQLVVRSTCGGRGHVNETLCAELQGVDIFQDDPAAPQ